MNDTPTVLKLYPTTFKLYWKHSAYNKVCCSEVECIDYENDRVTFTRETGGGFRPISECYLTKEQCEMHTNSKEIE